MASVATPQKPYRGCPRSLALGDRGRSRNSSLIICVQLTPPALHCLHSNQKRRPRGAVFLGAWFQPRRQTGFLDPNSFQILFLQATRLFSYFKLLLARLSS